jgi:hypothetical protein
MTDLTADLTRICDADNAQADHAPASVARALYLQRRVTALEQQNRTLHELALAAENYCWTVLQQNIGHRTDEQATEDLRDAVANYRHDHLKGARHDD